MYIYIYIFIFTYAYTFAYIYIYTYIYIYIYINTYIYIYIHNVLIVIIADACILILDWNLFSQAYHSRRDRQATGTFLVFGACCCQMSLKLVKLVKLVEFVPSFFLIFDLGQAVWTWTRCSLRDSHRGFRGAIGTRCVQTSFVLDIVPWDSWDSWLSLKT